MKHSFFYPSANRSRRSARFQRLSRSIGAVMLSLAMVTGNLFIPQHSEAAMNVRTEQMTKKTAPEDVSTITLDGSDIKKDNVNGLTYKGFGLLSCNSTSDLLLDYKAEQPETYARLMQYLFGGEHPIMTHVKLEMGNDRNNSTGSQPATWRKGENKTNILRDPSWQIAADAAKINPEVKVSILRWNGPDWVKTDEDRYLWYKEAILQAYETYGYMVDYINPNANEGWAHEKDIKTTKSFAKWIQAETKETIPDDEERKLFRQIKLIVTDEAEQFHMEAYNALQDDEEFRNAVAVAGYHYPVADKTDSGNGMTTIAETLDKEVWSSENQAAFSNSAFRPVNNTAHEKGKGTELGGTGSALEMGNFIVKGFTESRRTHIVYQPVVGSFYEGGEYSFKELVSARDPWSGWMHYDAGLLVLAHLSKFAKTGWENESNTAGIWRAVASASKSNVEGDRNVYGQEGADSYLTLAAPDGSDFTTLFVNNSGYTKNYTLNYKNMKLSDTTLEMWETRAADDGAFDENYLKCLGDLTPSEDGSYTIQVKPWSVLTVSSLNRKDSEEMKNTVLPTEGERTVLDTDETGSKQDPESKYLYADSFDYTGKTVPVLDGKGGFSKENEDYLTSRGGDTGAIPRYTNNLNGVFEAFKRTDGEYVLRQQLDQYITGKGGAWDSSDPIVTIGDFRWMNYAASTDVLFENTAVKQDKTYVGIGIRQVGGSASLSKTAGYTLMVYVDGAWKLYRKGTKDPVKSGTITDTKIFAPGYNAWNNLRLEGEGAEIRAYVNGNLIASYTDPNPITFGRIALGSGFHRTEYKNLKVTKLAGSVPYYTEFLDNMEMYDLSPEKNTKLVYNDKWSHDCGQGMYVYQRTKSTAAGAGASLTYTFDGTGLELVSSNAISDDKPAAKLKVIVDDTVLEGDQWTTEASEGGTIYTIQGLSGGKHTTTIELLEGALTVDAVGIIGAPAQIGETKAEVKAAEPILLDSYTTEPEPVPTATPKPTEAVTSAPAETTAPTQNQPTPVVSNTAAPGGTTAPTASAISAATGTPSADSGEISNGQIVSVGNASYQIVDIAKQTVAYQAPSKKNITTAAIPNTVKVQTGDQTITYQVTAIENNAFKNCKKLKSVVIGKNIKAIGKNAFAGCTNLKSIKIKSTVLKTIGTNAIKGIHKKAVIRCPKKQKKAYKKLWTKKTGFQKTMKIK